MIILEIIQYLEKIAPPVLQESYDNAGLITGNPGWECKGILTALDVTEAVVLEAIEKKCNLIVAHHPIIFSGLKKINGKNYVEKSVIAAIKNDIAVYAIHTNLDHVMNGVSGKIADKIGLVDRRILQLKKGLLRKLVTFVPVLQADEVRNAIFEAGAGHIGQYSECSFNSEGKGTFKAGENTNAFIGEKGLRHSENEIKIETVFPVWLENSILEALLKAHPYEEVAYDIYSTENDLRNAGAGICGTLPEPVDEAVFLNYIKTTFNLSIIRHTPLLGKKITKVAVCGGAGSFLINTALAAGADIFVTGDVKYHEFFDANDRMVIADIGHYESEQFTIDLLFDVLKEKFITFAVLKTGINTNPVQYF